MPFSGAIITKGFVGKRFDTLCKQLPNFPGRLQFLEKLPPYPQGNMATLAEAYGALRKEEADHLRNDWFSEKGWWPHLQGSVEPILRQGLIEAIREAIELKLPIDIVWISAGPADSAPFQAFITWSDQQVTFILHSPDVPAAYPRPDPNTLTVDEPVLIVKRDEATGQPAVVHPKTLPEK
ncbi:MAG TPA: hypothetical protein VKK81_24950 [Candidatus Binatia bacterium]|nr:hypothetical protein [Candidatus Binatia bacterium]